MRNFTIYLVVLLCLFASKMLGQETFEQRAKTIASKIETITKEEKAALKIEVEAVNNQLINGTITRDEAENKKKQLAETRARNIETKIAIEQEALRNLVQEQVEGKINSQLSNDKQYKGASIVIGGNSDSIRKGRTEINLTSMKVYQGQEEKENRQSKRTTSQFVFAAGLNNVVTNGTTDKSDFRYWGSHFYEWGLTYNTRIVKNNNLLHAKYGLSVMYNNLRPTDNRNFVVNGDQTNLAINPIDIKDSRFRNVYLVVPAHLEFDFSGKKMKADKSFFRTHQSVRFGIGGYAGINLKSKQIIKYDDNDLKVTEKTKGDFNTSNFIYGLSSYIGYKATSLYVKYDLNPLFKDNAVKQNNVSLGVRFDFN